MSRYCTKQHPLGLVVLIGLVSYQLCGFVFDEVEGVSDLHEQSSGSEVDFDGLNKWLVEALPADGDAQRNVDQVKCVMDKELTVSGPKVRRAAEIFVQFMEARQCNEDLLMGARLMLAADVDLRGVKRIERLLGWRLASIYRLCGRYIDQKVQAIYKSSLEPTLGPFLQVVVLEPHNWRPSIDRRLNREPDERFYAFILDHHHHHHQNETLQPSADRWWSHLQELVKRGQLREQSEETGVRWEAHNKYLLEPCRLLAAALGDTFMAIYGLSQHTPAFIANRSVAVKQLLYAFKLCQRLPSSPEEPSK